MEEWRNCRRERRKWGRRKGTEGVSEGMEWKDRESRGKGGYFHFQSHAVNYPLFVFSYLLGYVSRVPSPMLALFLCECIYFFHLQPFHFISFQYYSLTYLLISSSWELHVNSYRQRLSAFSFIDMRFDARKLKTSNNLSKINSFLDEIRKTNSLTDISTLSSCSFIRSFADLWRTIIRKPLQTIPNMFS